MSDKQVTAAELLRRLSADPEVRRRREEQESGHRRAEEELSRAEAPLVDALREAGCEVRTVWDLVNTTASYPSALPVLRSHLDRPYPPAIREGIARALGVPETGQQGWDHIIAAFRDERDARVKSGLAVAIAAAASADRVDDVLALLRDRGHGSCRVLLLDVLRRLPAAARRVILEELAPDPELGHECRRMLGAR